LIVVFLCVRGISKFYHLPGITGFEFSHRSGGDDVMFHNKLLMKGGRTGMTKAELIAVMAGKAAVTKATAAKALEAYTSAVASELKKSGKLGLVGFGTFSVVKRKARAGRNPQTGKAIKIAAKKVVKFKAGKALTDKVK
jgi:DNA-binding protein HU-beta